MATAGLHQLEMTVTKAGITSYQLCETQNKTLTQRHFFFDKLANYYLLLDAIGMHFCNCMLSELMQYYKM